MALLAGPSASLHVMRRGERSRINAKRGGEEGKRRRKKAVWFGIVWVWVCFGLVLVVVLFFVCFSFFFLKFLLVLFVFWVRFC